jgi:hypothetical protein
VCKSLIAKGSRKSLWAHFLHDPSITRNTVSPHCLTFSSDSLLFRIRISFQR